MSPVSPAVFRRAGVPAGLFVSLSVLLFLTGVPGYLWALHLERSWSRTAPASRADLESHLALYSTEIISPSQSAWGCHYILMPGERMIRYNLLWSAPLDVVYNSDDRIRRIFTTYE